MAAACARKQAQHKGALRHSEIGALKQNGAISPGPVEG
jgi:hypothetical protein